MEMKIMPPVSEGEARLLDLVSQIRKITSFVPKVALVLGSGLGGFADEIDVKLTINYADLKGFPRTSVEGHKGRLVFGFVKSTPVALMQGRVHYYEGFSMEDVVLPIRILRLLGAETLILTNAAGALNPDFRVGEFMLITDHISCFVPSPLRGQNYSALGTRFPDMTEVYDKGLQQLIKDAALKQSIILQEGVYVQTAGPNFETPTEIKLFRALGADVTGMSTACEAMAGVHCGFKVAGISCITNMASGITMTKLSHEEVQEVTRRKSLALKALLCEILSSPVFQA